MDDSLQAFVSGVEHVPQNGHSDFEIDLDSFMDVMTVDQSVVKQEMPDTSSSSGSQSHPTSPSSSKDAKSPSSPPG